MHAYRPEFSDYLINITYQGKARTYRLYPYHTEGSITSYMLFAAGRVLDFEFNSSTQILTQQLVHGEPPVPGEFLEAVQAEVREIHK